jgi:hypothetical protein
MVTGEVRKLPAIEISARRVRPGQITQVLDLFGEDSWRNVYAGELEVRPPGAPTILLVTVALPPGKLNG